MLRKNQEWIYYHYYWDIFIIVEFNINFLNIKYLFKTLVWFNNTMAFYKDFAYSIKLAIRYWQNETI